MAKSKTTTEEKPKKVLTEAQRLAFLKGREKRMANLEMKRQQVKEETIEQTIEQPVVDAMDESPKTDSPDESPPDPPVLKRQTNRLEPPVQQVEPVLESTKPMEIDIPKHQTMDDDAMARRIADLVFDRLQLEIPDTKQAAPIVASPKKKKKVAIKQEAPVNTLTPSVAIPQRNFAWA